MRKPKILVTGATGKTGGAVTERLLRDGWPVRALAHRRDPRADRLERLGAEVVIASARDPDQLSSALEGVSRAYYVPIFGPHAVLAAAAFATAVEGSRLEALVQMSQWLSQPSHPSILTRETWLIDRMFGRLSVAHVIVNPGMFADNFLRMIDMPALLGLYPVFTGASRSAPVSTEDIAACVVALLARPDAHAGQSFRPTGPALLSGRDMAAAIGRAVARKVRAIDLPFALFLKAARLDRVSPREALNWRDYVEDHRAGAFEQGPSDVVERLVGRPAEDFETIARRYAALPFARATLGNLVRIVAKMAALPFVPGLDIDSHARAHSLPAPAVPRLSAKDERWREQHGVAAPAMAES